MKLNQWILFEADICEGCNHPKLAKLCPNKNELQVIISCDCDMTVFDHAWKHARDNDELVVVVEGGVMDLLEGVAKFLGENK